MSDAARSFAAAGIIGLAAYALIQYRAQQQAAQAAVSHRSSPPPPASRPKANLAAGVFELAAGVDWHETAPQQPSKSDRRRALIGSLLGEVIGAIGRSSNPRGSTQPPGSVVTPKGVSTPAPVTVPVSTPAPAKGGLGGLLNLIGKHESGGDYNRVYGGIRSADRPPRQLTTMTVQEVLDWQDSIDPRYPSEAAGKYQFMEDTLRDMVRAGKVSPNARFDARTQDRLAVLKMDERGLGRYQSGQITGEQFAHSLSKEWASLPAITRDKRGRAARGQSYYAGDGLNRSSVGISDFLGAVRSI